MKLNEEFFNEIAAKIIKEGGPDDMAKFMLSGKQPIAAVQRYFDRLEADKKKELILIGDEWFFVWYYDDDEAKKHTGLPLFKLVAASIIPFVEDLEIINTHLHDYSFLRDIKNLDFLKLQFKDNEHSKVLPALSNLQAVGLLILNFKGLNLQLLSSLCFSFDDLVAFNFIFETNPKYDKVFQATQIELYGDQDLKNDFVFTHQNFANYAAIFPKASILDFKFYIKLVDDFSDIMKAGDPRYRNEIEANLGNRDLRYLFHFFDYSGYPDSKVLKMLQDDENWNTSRCPYSSAYTKNYYGRVSCSFPLAITKVGNILAERALRRIPENNNGKPEDYRRVTIQNRWGHKAEFEVLKTTSVESLLKAYGELTGINPQRLQCHTDLQNISDGDLIYINYDLYKT